MPTFKYQAKKENGEPSTGIVEAPNLEAASELLKEKKLIIISIKERTFQQVFDKILNYMNRVRNKDVVFFARQLSVMLEANVPLVKSLRIMVKQTSNPYFQVIISDVASDVDGGAKLSQALGRYSKIFNKFFVHMIRAGETTGRLDKVLVYLADQMEKDYALRGRIKGAMIYPAFILSVLVIMGFLMMIFVVPKFVSIFESGNIDLPWTTKTLIFVSNAFVDYWWILMTLAVIFAAAFYIFNRSEAGHFYVDLLKVKIPIIGSINWKTYMVRFSRSLSSLLSSGVPVTKSLEITAEIVSNDVYKQIFMKAAQEVEVGKTISSVLIKDKNIPLLVTHMINIGEETGKLDRVLVKIGDFYESETDTSIKALVSLIEPMIMVLIGIAAAGLVVSILLPMYDLTESIT